MNSKGLIFATGYEPAVKAGGTVRAITNLVKLARVNNQILVVASDRDVGEGGRLPGIEAKDWGSAWDRAYYYNPSSIFETCAVYRGLHSAHFDVLLLNSIWHWKLSALPAFMVNLGVLKCSQVVLMPHGELGEGALAISRRKKKLVAPLARRIYGRVVTTVAVTADDEEAAAREWFPNATVLRVTNVEDSLCFSPHPPPGAVPRVAFMSRIHEKKGLLEAIEALVETEARLDFSIYGPIEDQSYWEKCIQAGNSALDVKAAYRGVVHPDDVPLVLARNDVLVLLTANENFGHIISEALQVGTRVICTDQTPWTHTLVEGAGWIVPDRTNRYEVGRVFQMVARSTRSERVGWRTACRQAYDLNQETRSPTVFEALFE